MSKTIWEFELDHLLNSAAVFDHPADMLKARNLTSKRRHDLSSWTSDACPVDSAPTLTAPAWRQSSDKLRRHPLIPMRNVAISAFYARLEDLILRSRPKVGVSKDT